MEPDAPARDIERTVRQARGYWRRVGVPRAARRRKADELRDHLRAAAEDGHSVQEVVGRDPIGFAAEWAQGDREHPLAELALQLGAAVPFAVGMLALLGPVMLDTARTGVTSGALAFVGLVMAGSVAIQLARTQRGKLTTQHAALLGVAYAAFVFVGYATLVQPAYEADAFVPLAPAISWMLIAVGLVLHLASRWMRRKGWL